MCTLRVSLIFSENSGGEGKENPKSNTFSFARGNSHMDDKPSIQPDLADSQQVKKVEEVNKSEPEMNKDKGSDHSPIPAGTEGTQTAEKEERFVDVPVSPTASKSTGNSEGQNDRPTVQFPWRLHELLTEAETNGNDSIISWIPGTNNAFKVHNKEKFTNNILPEYFNATKYKSFQRNLNLWGFESITEGPNKGGCQHHIFIRGDREKCHYMTRQKVKGQKQKQADALAASLKDAGSVGDLRRSSLSLLSGFGGSPAAAAAATFQAKNNAVSSLGPLDGKGLNFCDKLHRILALPELQGCMRWTSDGRAIAIVNPYQFNGIAVNNFFPGMNLSGFLAELEAYGFKKITHGGFQDCYYHDMMMKGCKHLCKYLSTPFEARRFVSDDPSLDPSQTRNVASLPTSNQGMPTDPSSLQHLLQLQATGGLGNMLSSQVPRTTQDSLSSSLALLSGQPTLSNTLNPASLQLLGNNMQNRSAIASYITELQLRQQQKQQQQQGSVGGSSDGGFSGASRGSQA